MEMLLCEKLYKQCTLQRVHYISIGCKKKDGQKLKGDNTREDNFCTGNTRV